MTNGLSETDSSLSATSTTHLKKYEPHVLFSVNKQNQVTIVVNQRELHQQEML